MHNLLDALTAAPIFKVILILIITGVGLWLINQYVPMQPPIKIILNTLVVILLFFWLLRIFGII